MTKSITPKKPFDRDYFIQKKVPKHLHEEFDQWRDLRSLPHGKEARSQIGNVILQTIFEETSFLNKELIEKINKVFIEGTIKEKLNFMADRYFEMDKKFPYLTTQQPITLESAGFLPLPCVIPFYWENKFLCFQCIIKKCPIDLPRISLRDSKGHRITVKIATPEFCLRCVELSKKQKTGLTLFSHIKLEQIKIYKEKMELRKQPKHQYVKAITKKLEKEGIRRSYKEVKAIFQNLIYDKEAKKWKKISKASKATGTSRPMIYKLIELFPEGVS